MESQEEAEKKTEGERAASGSKFALGSFVLSLLVPIGLIVYLRFTPYSSPVAPQSIHQAAGQAPLDENFLKGGLLQRDLRGNEQPQEFIDVETGTKVPRFATREFTVHAGSIVSVTLRNNSKVGHSENWVLVRPGTSRQVQSAAQSAPPIWEWIPESANVLAFVPLTKPGEFTIRLFRAPSQPGDYPFLCTYANRGTAMNGVLHVIG